MTPPVAGARPFNLHEQCARGWAERAEVCAGLVARLVERAGRRLKLSDLGCGDTKLRQVLTARGVDVDYAGFDLLPQHPEVRLLDLTRDDPPPGADIAVMLGVGEYLPNLAQVLQKVAASSRWLVFTHVLRGKTPISAKRLAELGWTNHLDAPALEALVARAGLEVIERRLTSNRRTVVLLCAGSGHAAADA